MARPRNIRRSTMSSWGEKHRPTRLDDIVLADRVRTAVSQFIGSGRVPNVLMSGKPGTALRPQNSSPVRVVERLRASRPRPYRCCKLGDRRADFDSTGSKNRKSVTSSARNEFCRTSAKYLKPKKSGTFHRSTMRQRATSDEYFRFLTSAHGRSSKSVTQHCSGDTYD